jgi:hypothetical protein
MTWTLEYNRTLRIVDVVFAGITSGRDLQEATTKCILLGKEQDTVQFLVDAAELELFAPLVDIIDLPDKQYVMEGLDRLSRVALVSPRSPKAKEAAYFYETACINRGWSVRLFPKRDDAIEWLTSAEFSKKQEIHNG